MRFLFHRDQDICSTSADALNPPPTLAPRVPQGQDLLVIQSLEELETWEAEWNQLSWNNPEPVAAFRWNQAWYRAHRDVIDEILVFLTFREGMVSAILPAYVQENEIRLAGDEFLLRHDLICPEQKDAKKAMDSIVSWISAERPEAQIRWENLSTEGIICDIFLEKKGPYKDVVLLAEESNSRPFIELSDGYAEYLRSLPKEVNEDLRCALRVIDRDLPRARIEIKRGYDIRVDVLSQTLLFVDKNGKSNGTPFYFDSCTVAFLGELAKCEEVGLQMGRLLDQGDTFAADIGLAYRGGYFPLMYAFDSQFSEVNPYESLFLSRINDWITRDGVGAVFFPCRDEVLSHRLAGENKQTMRSLMVLDSQELDRTSSPSDSTASDEKQDDEATAPILAR